MNDLASRKSEDFSPLDIYGNVQRITRIFYSFTAIILICLTVGIFILLSNHNTLQAGVLAVAILFILPGFFLISRREFEKAASFLAVLLILAITVISTSDLGIHSLSILGFPAILIVASLVIRKRTLIYLTILVVACVAWLVFGELLGIYTSSVLTRSVPGDFFTVAITAIATSIMARTLTEALFQSSLDVQKELKERKRVEERLAYDAMHDALTSLPNRSLFHDRLGQRLEHARRHPQDLFAVLFIDLDRFKVVNDSLGHAVGDQLLIAAAQRLKQCIRPEDTVSRLSGDEFAVLLDGFKDISDAVRVAERIQAQLTLKSLIADLGRLTTASIGIAVYNAAYTNPQDLLRDADSAMYRAKASGGGRYAIFDDTLHANAVALLQLEADLKRAVENQEWLICYQPIVTLPEREIIGVEALLRWHHPQRGLIQPREFIQVAEETGLIVPIGEYVLREACRQMKAWRRSRNSRIWMSVNLSGRQFQDQNLVRTIEGILREVELPSQALQMEITESVAMNDFVYSAKVLNRLERMGIRISMDDFGIGYSTLGNLNRFSISTLKIDRSFIKNIGRNRNSEAIIAAIISIGHALGMQVIAEGVEVERELAFLQSLSCDRIQGNLISRPVPARQFEKLLSL